MFFIKVYLLIYAIDSVVVKMLGLYHIKKYVLNVFLGIYRMCTDEER